MVLDNWNDLPTIEQARLHWMEKAEEFSEAQDAVKDAWDVLQHLKNQAEYKRIWDSYHSNINRDGTVDA